MRLHGLGLALLLMGIGATIGGAQDKAPAGLDRIELDRRIVKIVFDSASLGTEIFNKGNAEGCFRVYQATLMAVQLLLDHRLPLAKMVREKLERAKGMNPVEGSWLLRSALDDIQNEIAPNTRSDGYSKPETKGKTALWERLGSTPGVRKIAHVIVLNAIEDPKLGPKILQIDKKPDAKALEQNLFEYISSKTGGLFPYNGPNPKTAFAGMKITDDEFSAFGAIVEGALKRNDVAAEDIKEFMAILESIRKDVVEVRRKD
jgi:hemoglobin